MLIMRGRDTANTFCTAAAAPVIRLRLGDIDLHTVQFGEKRTINGVEFSFHPAGHIPGSAQIRVEYRGEVWVVSGDYKVHPDNLSETFEPIRCHSFISECTFGLPVFKWNPQADVHVGNQRLVARQCASRTDKRDGCLFARQGTAAARRHRRRHRPYLHPWRRWENTNAVLRAQGA